MDRFELRKEGNSLFLSESELKHRFRVIAPHSTVYRPSKSEVNHAFVLAAFGVGLIIALAYVIVEHSKLALLSVVIASILVFIYEKYNSSLRSRRDIS